MSEPGQLVRYDAACRALAEAVSVDEAKDILNIAVAMAAYARQAKNRDLEADAVEIRMRATRRIDQLRQAQKDSVGLATGGEHGGRHRIDGLRENPSNAKPTLASQGIDKNLAHHARVLGALSDEKFEAAIADTRDRVARALRTAVREVELREHHNNFSLETPPTLLPSPTGRTIRVARNADLRRWILAIGPSISQATLKERETAAHETDAVRQLQRARDELLERAVVLEVEAKALREDAKALEQKIGAEVKTKIGHVAAFTETFDFQADEATDTELAGLPQKQLVDRLLAARGTGNGPLRELERGCWGDMKFMSYGILGPGPGWTKCGSGEWLDQLFASLNAAESGQGGAP